MTKLMSVLGIVAMLGSMLLVAPCQAEEKEKPPIVAPTDADKALAARALELAQKAQGTQGQESANFLLNDWPRGCARILAGEQPANAKDLEFARGLIGGIADCLQKAPTWPKQLAVDVPYTKQAPVIDGKLDDRAWKKALVLKGAYVLNDTKCVNNTTWRLMWDEQNLYVGVQCDDAEIVAPKLPHNGDIYNYDCVELFLLPDLKKGQYWELEMSASGDLYEAMNTKWGDHWGGAIDYNAHLEGLRYVSLAQPKTRDGKDTGFTVEMAVPFNQLPGAAKDARAAAGTQIHFLLARMDKNKDSFTAYCFRPLLSWTHNIWNYATMTLKK